MPSVGGQLASTRAARTGVDHHHPGDHRMDGGGKSGNSTIPPPLDVGGKSETVSLFSGDKLPKFSTFHPSTPLPRLSHKRTFLRQSPGPAETPFPAPIPASLPVSLSMSHYSPWWMSCETRAARPSAVTMVTIHSAIDAAYPIPIVARFRSSGAIVGVQGPSPVGSRRR